MILDGKKIAQEIISDLKKKIHNQDLKLSVVLVGDNPVSLSYISQKKKMALEMGVFFEIYHFNKDIDFLNLSEKIKKIVSESSGVIIQLPLPSKFNIQEVLNLIPKEKDIDFLSVDSLGKFYTGDFSILPPVVGAVSYIFLKNNIDLKSKNVVIIGVGRLVGKPLALWMMSSGATVSILNKRTKDISFFTKNADIIISGAGEPDLIKGNMVKDGVIAIDAGSSIEEGKITGDFHKESILLKASFFSTVPGGIGPITTACLLENLVKLNNMYNS